MKYCKQIFHRVNLVLLLILILGIQISFADGKIDYPRLRKDLNIMSTILDKIMNPDNDQILGSSNTRAVYLEGHGVLFIFYDKMSLSHIVISNNGDEMLDEHYIIKSASKTPAPEKSKRKKDIEEDKKYQISKQIEVTARTKKKQLTEIQTKLEEFLGDYCGAMKQLSPSDLVTVIVISENSMVYQLNQWKTFKQKPESAQLVASVSFGDITAYRRDKIDRESFVKRIQMQDKPTGAEIDKDLKIMSNIFSVALQQHEESDLIFGKDISGVYLQNFGALFVLSFKRNFRTKILQVESDYENLLSVINEEEEHFVKKGKVIADELKQDVIDVLADYGHNLKQLKDDEWIGVAADLNQISGKESEPGSLFFKVQKKDVIAVSRAKINRNEFKKRVVVSSY